MSTLYSNFSTITGNTNDNEPIYSKIESIERGSFETISHYTATNSINNSIYALGSSQTKFPL